MIGELSSTGSALSYAVGVICFRLSTFKIKVLPLVVYNTTITCILFFIFTLVTKSYPTGNLTLVDYVKIVISGIIGVSFGDVLYMYSLSKLGAGLTAIVTCLYAPFVVLLAAIMFGEGISLPSIIGGCMILASILIVLENKNVREENKKVVPIVFICAAISVFMMAYAILMIRDILRIESLLFIASLRFFSATITIWIIAIISKNQRNCISVFIPQEVTKWTLEGAFFGSFLSVFLWFIGFKYIVASKAAIYNQLSTIFIVLLASIFLKEKLTLRKALAVIFAFIGAILNSL